MTDSLVFETLLPQPVIIAIAVLCIGAALLFLIQRPLSGALRTAALAGLMGLLLNPQIISAERTPLDDIALIVVDESESQTLDGRMRVVEETVSRLKNRLAALGNVEIRETTIAGEEETRLVDGLARGLADIPHAQISSVFLVTDGQASDQNRIQSVLRANNKTPVHLLSTGRADEADRKITLLSAPKYGIVREKVKISFRIDDLGPNDEAIRTTGQASVTLRVDGEEAFQQPVPVGAEVSFDAPLNRPGAMVIELEVEEREGELTTRNNIAVLPITAIRDRLRVLLISGEPHPGERVWRNLLKSDPAIDLVHFTILRPLDKADSALQHELALIEFPQNELFIEKLSEFDLLIFDRYTYRGVMNAFHFDNIARYVEDGGAVLIASGPEFNGPLSLAAQRNLSFVLPALPGNTAIETPFRPLISDIGDRHPVTADLPEQNYWGRWLRIMPVQQRSGRTLMEDENGAPLLILDRVGKGRVSLLLSDHVWLWARGFDGGGPHAELLRRIAHWSMKEPELEEEQLSLTAIGDDLMVQRRTLEETAPPVTLTFPNGDTTELALEKGEPGQFSSRMQNAPRGLYRARSGDLFAVGTIGLAAAPEFKNVLTNNQKLAPLIEETDGGVFQLRRGNEINLPAVRRVRASSSSRSGAGWAGLVARNASRVDSIRSRPLASPWIWLGVIAASLLGAWWLEGRKSVNLSV